MKPIPSQVRRVSPFGSPKGGRVVRPDETKRGRRRVVQIDPPHGGIDARAPRQRRGRGPVAAPASRAYRWPGIAGLHPAAGRASPGPLNGFSEAFAGLLRHRRAGRRRRVSDTPATGVSDAVKPGKPAYPLSYNGAGEGVAPAPPSNPPRVALPWRSRLGAPPPSPRAGAA